MCGIVGIVGQADVNQDIYDALTILQHRGQDSAGIFTCETRKFHARKTNGLVREAFQKKHMLRMKGNMGIGHVRYPTAGSSSSQEAQPFFTNAPFGIALAHNGNLINAKLLKEEVFAADRRHVNTESDSETLLNVFAHELWHSSDLKLQPSDIFDAVTRVHQRCLGGYAVVAMLIGHGVVAFRDPNGIRPICFGKRETSKGMEYMVASESVALDALGFSLERDLAPGEAIYFAQNGEVHSQLCSEQQHYAPCIFEYVYFARPDSIMDHVSVYKARLRMGENLAKRIKQEWPHHDIDVVIPVPDTSRTSALPMAYSLGVKYREGFVKNRYIGRTFIMPGQGERERSVKKKLNAIGLEFNNKNVLLVDDSIVRGTTSKQIVEMAREAGARKVYFASAAPPVRYPNVYGIDMPACKEFVAHDKNEEEIRQLIGADKLFYQTMDDLVEAVRRGNPSLYEFDLSCFSGEYITGGVSEEYLTKIERERNDKAKRNKTQERLLRAV